MATLFIKVFIESIAIFLGLIIYYNAKIKKVKLLITFISVLILWFLSFFSPNAIIRYSWLMSGLFVIYIFILKMHFKKALQCFFAFFIAMMTAEFLGMIVIGFLQKYFTALPDVIFSGLDFNYNDVFLDTIFISIMIIYHYIGRKYFTAINTIHERLLMVLAFISVIMILLFGLFHDLFYQNDFFKFSYFIGMSFLIILVVFSHFLIFMVYHFSKTIDSVQALNVEKAQYDSIIQHNKQYLHNLNHISYIIRQLVLDEDYETLNEYIKEVSQTIDVKYLSSLSLIKDDILRVLLLNILRNHYDKCQITVYDEIKYDFSQTTSRIYMTFNQLIENILNHSNDLSLIFNQNGNEVIVEIQAEYNFKQVIDDLQDDLLINLKKEYQENKMILTFN